MNNKLERFKIFVKNWKKIRWCKETLKINIFFNIQTYILKQIMLARLSHASTAICTLMCPDKNRPFKLINRLICI